MSNSLNEGSDVVQANRLAGKPFRSTVTKWYAIYWTAYSFLYSFPRYSLGLSPFLTGTGFAVRTSLLQKYGWKTTSMKTQAFSALFPGMRRRPASSWDIKHRCLL